MNKTIVGGLIIVLALNLAAILIGFSYLQGEISDLKLRLPQPSSVPTLEPMSTPTPTPSTAQTPTIEPSQSLTQIPNPTINHTPPKTPEPTPTSSPTQTPNEQLTITKPIVAEFTLKFIDSYYMTAPTYSMDPFTGKNVTTESGYRIDNRTIEIAIKNQPFTQDTFANGSHTSLYYNIGIKGHYADKWTLAPDPHYYGYYNASTSDYTVISIRFSSYGLSGISAGGQIDVQVEALIGIDRQIPTMTPWGPSSVYEFTGETSGWSEIQTITIT